MKLTRQQIEEALEILEDDSVCKHPETRQYCYHRVQELQEVLKAYERTKPLENLPKRHVAGEDTS